MSLEIHLEAVIKRHWRPESSECGDALGGRDGANLEAVIERAWRCPPGLNRASLEINLEALIERVWRP